jgi:chromosome segregation ATPase
MAVTPEQIFDAADQIAAAGQRPTLDAVRQIVGGSYTTISPALNEWKAKQKAAASLREPAPAAVGERLAAVGADIWALALELANSRLAAEREALEKARVDMNAAQAEAVELADQLTAELEAAKAKIAALEAAASAATGEAAELRAQVVAVTERAATAEARAGELRTELDHAHQSVDQARKEANQARTDAARLAGQIEAHKEQAAALLARIQPGEGKGATTRKKSSE